MCKSPGARQTNYLVKLSYPLEDEESDLMRVCDALNFLFFALNRVPFHRLGIFYDSGKGYDEKTVFKKFSQEP